MKRFREDYETRITDLIKQEKQTNDKQLSYLCQNELFDFFEGIIINQNTFNNELNVLRSIKPYSGRSIPFENIRNLLIYVNILFFNEIKEKLQNSKENSKATKIKLNELDETPSKLWKLKVEDYITEVEFLLRKILKSNVDDERNFKITMILSSDFSNLLENKSNNEFHCFAKFDNLLKKYNIKCANHPFLNKSNEFMIAVPNELKRPTNKKINSNLENDIILLVITNKQDDFRWRINDVIESCSYEVIDFVDRFTQTRIFFDKNKNNLSKAKIFAIKS